MSRIHSTAWVPGSIHLPSDIEIGPYAVLEKDVKLGRGIRIGPFCHLYSGVELESGVALEDGVVVGNAPQIMGKFPPSTRTVIGAESRLREYVTVNRSSKTDGETRVGKGCLIMAYVHVGHDCRLGDRAVVANGVQLGGHVWIGDDAVVSGLTGVHQFVSIGSGAFIGGGLRVDQDIPPYCRALGDPLRWGGLNLVGLRRTGSETETVKFLEAFYRKVYQENSEAALAWMKDQSPVAGVRDSLGEFFRLRQRGLLRRGLSDTLAGNEAH